MARARLPDVLDTAVDPAARATRRVAPTRPRRWLPWLRGALAVLLPTALAAAHASLYGRWEVDDAGITFAYARSVATGAGPVLQPGAPPVEGFSDPAWLGLLVLGRRLGLFDHGTWFGVPDYVAYPKTLALLLLAVVFAAFLAAASTVTRYPAAVTAVAGCACALIPSLVIWSVSGLENALLAAAVAVQAAVLVRRRGALAGLAPALACGLLAALAALTRPEGAVYAASYPLALLLVGRGWWRCLWSGALSTAAFAVPFGAYLAWRLATFGQWVPTTAVAKSQGLPTVAGFAKVGGLIGYAGWPVVLVGALVVGAALARRPTEGPPAAATMSWRSLGRPAYHAAPARGAVEAPPDPTDRPNRARPAGSLHASTRPRGDGDRRHIRAPARRCGAGLHPTLPPRPPSSCCSSPWPWGSWRSASSFRTGWSSTASPLRSGRSRRSSSSWRARRCWRACGGAAGCCSAP